MVILFDGVCSLCNGFVRFILKRDKNKTFQFASLQSTYGAGLLAHFNFTLVNSDTIILYNGKKIFTQSDALLKIVSPLNGIWKCAVIFKIIPGFIRNSLYRLVAKNRYKLFGKNDQCMVPPEGVKDRFLDDAIFE